MEKLKSTKPFDNKSSFKEFKIYYSQWKNFKLLLGTSICWFCQDVSFYGTNLNTPIIIATLNFS
jgi:PHS family inorganic phosphate transporter-like MFS transporter